MTRPSKKVCTAFLAAPVVAAGASAESAVPRIGDWGVDLSARNVDVRPQDDFFRYANGTWLKEYEIPDDLPGYGSFTDLFLQSEEHVRLIIEEVAAADSEHGSEAQKISDLYNDYLDLDAIERAGITSLEGDLAVIRAAESHEDIARLLATYVKLGGGTPFNHFIDQDPKSPDHYIAHFTQGGIGLPDREYYLDAENPRFAKALEARRTYLVDMLGFAGHEDPEGNAEHILAMERKFAEAHWPSEDTRDVDATYNKLTPGELRELAPDFPWVIYLAELGLGDEDAYIIYTPSAYTGMASAFASTPVEHWRAYLVGRLMGSHAQFLPKDIDDAQFRFISAAFTGSAEQREREKRAVQFVNGSIGRAISKLYVVRHFPPEAKQRIDELVQNLIVAMGMRIDALEWMSEETKRQARDKLSKFSVKVGYPDEWRDYSELEVAAGDLVGNVRRARLFEYARNHTKLGKPVDRNEWLMNAQTVNAYYNPQMNEIVFPAGILQPPFFDPYADDAVNYGAIGAVIGHEIGHGFDDQGRKSDGDGVKRDWWTDEDAERFQTRADMLVKQYDGYSPLEGMNVNGELTLGENIGDVGGIEIAYHAYHISLKEKGELELVDGLTGDQRFFLGFAQIWKGKMRDELMAMLVSSNPHSPVEFRVNGAVRNVDAWYEAFGVGEGDAMYLPPEDRARIW